MSEKKKVKINGFVFTDEAEAEQAKKEAHGIHYVEERADMHHPETVLEIYNKMVKQELFETAVGFTYLNQGFLQKTGRAKRRRQKKRMDTAKNMRSRYLYL